jgi:hypothetical protein
VDDSSDISSKAVDLPTTVALLEQMRITNNPYRITLVNKVDL